VRGQKRRTSASVPAIRFPLKQFRTPRWVAQWVIRRMHPARDRGKVARNFSARGVRSAGRPSSAPEAVRQGVEVRGERGAATVGPGGPRRGMALYVGGIRMLAVRLRLDGRSSVHSRDCPCLDSDTGEVQCRGTGFSAHLAVLRPPRCPGNAPYPPHPEGGIARLARRPCPPATRAGIISRPACSNAGRRTDRRFTNNWFPRRSAVP